MLTLGFLSGLSGVHGSPRLADELPLVQMLSGAAAAPTGRNDQADGAKKGLLNHYWQLTQVPRMRAGVRTWCKRAAGTVAGEH